MALVVKDRVRETSITAGTGALTLGGAVNGFQTFSVIGDGNTTYYAIVDVATGSWEVGIGTYTSSGPSLSRDTVLESSNSGNLVPFAANLKDVFVTYPAEKSVYADAAGVVNVTTLDATNLEVANIKAQDSTAAATIANSTGAITVSSLLNVDNLRLDGNAITSTDTNGNIDLTPNGTGEVNITKVDIASGEIDGTTIGANSASTGKFTSVTNTALTATRVPYTTTGGLQVDSANMTFDGTALTVSSLNTTTLDLTNLEVTNIKAKDGTAAATIADTTGKITVSSELAVDNLNLSSNTISSTDTNGNIVLAPNGTGQVVVNAGALATPTIAPTGDLNTGIYFPAADTIAFVEGGVEILRLNSSAQVVIAGSGTALLPVLTIAGDTNTGIYSPGADQFAISTAGTVAVTFDAAGNTNVAGALGVGDAADSTSITINAAKTYTSNATRYGLYLATTITDSTLTASRNNYGIVNVNTITQASLGAFTLSGYGQYNQVYNGSANDVTSNATTLFGTRSLAQNRATGTVTTMYGAYNQASNARSGSTTTTLIAGNNISSVTLGTVSAAYGSYNEVQIDGGTLTTAYGTYNLFDHNGGTLSTAYGSFINFDGTIGTKLGYVVESGSTMDFGITGDVNGVTVSTMRFGIVNTTTPTSSRVTAKLFYDTANTNEQALILGSDTTSGTTPDYTTIQFNSNGSIFNQTTGSGAVATIKAYNDGNIYSLNFLTNGTVWGYGDEEIATGNKIVVFQSDEIQINAATASITGGNIVDITTSGSGNINLYAAAAVTYTMTSGNLFVLEGNNTGLTSTTAVNTLRFTDTDTSTASNQPIGKIEFYTSDTSAGGTGVSAYILSAAAGTSGGGNLVFGTAPSAGSGSPVERMRIQSGGLIVLDSSTGLSISATGVTSPSSANGNVFSGTYTPSLTNTTNIAASSIPANNTWQYMRVGNVVTVSGRVNIDPTAASTASEMGISLPIASNFDYASDLGGVGSMATTTTEVSTGGILADTTNDRATFRFVSGGTASRDYYITFTYKVI